MFLEMVISYTAAVNANNYQNLVLECKTRPLHGPTPTWPWVGNVRNKYLILALRPFSFAW